MSRRRMTRRERWLSAVCDLRTDGRPVGLQGRSGAPRQHGSFRVVMALLSMYADNDTGGNARPSLRLLQEISHYKYTTVRGALSVAETAGYIVATGNWTPPKGGDPITVWALGYPTDEGFVPWSVSPLGGTTDEPSVSPLDGTTAGESTGRDHRPEVGESTGRDHRSEEVGGAAGRHVGGAAGRHVGGAAGRPTTSSTSRPQGSEEDEEEEGASAPAPKGADTTRLEADVFTVLRQRWPDETPVVSNRSRLRLAELLDNGWTEAQITAAVNTIGKSPRSPSLLLETHLHKMLTEHEPRDFGAVSNLDTTATAATADQADDVERCPHGVSRALPEGTCSACADYRERVKAAFEQAKRDGFTVNRGPRDDEGDLEYRLIGMNITIGVDVDAHNDPWGLTVYARRPPREHLSVMGMYGKVLHDEGSVYYEVNVDIASVPECFPDTLTQLAGLLGPNRKEQPA